MAKCFLPTSFVFLAIITFTVLLNAVRPQMFCPEAPPGSDYEEVMLKDNSIFKYWVVWNTATRFDAEAFCEANGGKLVKILTVTKMRALRFLFTQCPGYINSGNYWIDGSNLNATDGNDITQWTTSDGESLPRTFWSVHWPQMTDMNHCVALWSSMGGGMVYKWVNPPCEYQCYFICEK